MVAAVGSSVAGYRLEQVLGRGGMGVVYRAWDERLGRRVALKLIAPDVAADAGFRERFLREVRLAAAVEHPHVVPVHDAGEDDGTLYLAMRLIDGPDLDSLLDAGPLPVAVATRIVAQVAHALAAVHAQGLIHRDVTARNVLVPVLDGAEHAYLTDFGLARDAAPGGTITGEGRWAGTLDYAAPERLAGRRGDRRTDVYALGCLLYQTLTATAPFPVPDAAAKVTAHLTAPPPPLPGELKVAVPHLEAVVARALAKDPDDRYAVVARALAKDPDDRYADTLELARDLQVAPDAPTSAQAATLTEIESAPRSAARPGSEPPTAVNRTVGRDEEIRAAGALLLDGTARLVTFTGPGGTGKTRLAAEVARRVGAQLAGGAAFVSLAPVAEPANVADAIAGTLGLTVPAATPEAIARAIGDEELLLVLDNFEHVLPAAPLASELIGACPRLRVLATSRERLRLQGERLFPVAPLPVPDASQDVGTLGEVGAVALFVERARAQDPSFELDAVNAGAVAEICARLDGLPLAIELAAARVGLLEIGELAARLGDALGLLGSGPRDAPDRHRTLEATIEWSFRLLAPAEQDALLALAVFAGGCTLDAAEAVTQAPLPVLLALVEKSLLSRGQGRLRMLETVRTFALDRLGTRPDADAVRRRHAEHFVALAEREERMLFRGDVETRRRLEADVENLRLALSWVAERDAGLLVRLASASAQFWWRSGRSGEGRAWVDAALDSHPAPAGTARAALLAARLTLMEPFAARSVGFEAELYERDGEEALALYAAAGDDAGAALCLIALSRGRTRLDDREAALALAARALQPAHAAGDDLLIGMACIARGIAEERLTDALAALLEAADHLRRSGSPLQVAAVMNTGGYMALVEGDLDVAERMLADSAAVAALHGDDDSAAYVHGNIGLLRLLQGRIDEAATAFGAELRTCRAGRFPKQVLVCEALTGLAAVAAARGEHETAARLDAAAAAVYGEPLPEFERGFFEDLDHRFLDPARAALGPERWETAVAAGQRLTVAEAIDEGLAVAGS